MNALKNLIDEMKTIIRQRVNRLHESNAPKILSTGFQAWLKKKASPTKPFRPNIQSQMRKKNASSRH